MRGFRITLILLLPVFTGFAMGLRSVSLISAPGIAGSGNFNLNESPGYPLFSHYTHLNSPGKVTKITILHSNSSNGLLENCL